MCLVGIQPHGSRQQRPCLPACLPLHCALPVPTRLAAPATTMTTAASSMRTAAAVPACPRRWSTPRSGCTRTTRVWRHVLVSARPPVPGAPSSRALRPRCPALPCLRPCKRGCPSRALLVPPALRRPAPADTADTVDLTFGAARGSLEPSDLAEGQQVGPPPLLWARRGGVARGSTGRPARSPAAAPRLLRYRGPAACPMRMCACLPSAAGCTLVTRRQPAGQPPGTGCHGGTQPAAVREPV